MKQISLPKWAYWICLLLVSSVMSQTISAEAAEECQSYRGTTVCPLGSATLEVAENDERLYLDNHVSEDSSGIAIDARDGNQWSIELDGLDPREAPDARIVLESANHATSEVFGMLSMTSEGESWRLNSKYAEEGAKGFTVEVHKGDEVTTFDQRAIEELFLRGLWVGAYRIVISTPDYYYEEWCIFVVSFEEERSAMVSIEGKELPVDMLTIRTAPISAEKAAERPADTVNLIGRQVKRIEITDLDISNKSLNTATPDLGDAPDSTNHYLNSMSAYAGTMAHYPTVFDVATSMPVGPLHHNSETWYSLGPDISWEQEADNGFDSDWGVHNIDPFTDAPDRDRFDDGLLLPGHFSACEPTQMTFTVDVLPAATATDAYVNVWIDWDKSGTWGEVQKCLQGPSTEWAVQNQVISWSGPGYHTFTTDVFMPPSQGAPDESWIRISLSDDVAPAADGRGPAAGWDYGETEDYLWEAAAGEICGLKFHDENGNSVNDGESGISGWPIYIVDSSGMTTTATTDVDGKYCVSLPPGDYTVHEDPNGMVQTFPSTVDYDVTVVLGQTINNIDFGNKKPCDHPLDDSCTAGTHDLFTGPEPTYVNPNDVAGGWLTSCSSGALSQFDVTAQNQCFAHSFDIANGDECLSHDCIIGGVMTIRLKAGRSSLASNDTIHFLENGTNVWSSRISNLPGGSGWGANATGTFTFDLTDMPNGGANILSMVMDGDLTIRIQDDTGVDWIDLDILYCDEEPPESEGDLGDAPTSYNHFDMKMSAYPGDPLGSARYPTVFDSPSGTPIGPYHHFPREQAWLGKWVSLEDEADINPALDEDVLTNIDPPNDLNNRDGFDDSVNPTSIQLPQCGETKFKYTVSSDAAATLTSWHTNVWFDFNQDGDWDDQFRCKTDTGSVLAVYEWAVQDQAITVSPGSAQVVYATPAFVAAAGSADKSTWMRITLTKSPINGHPETSPPTGGNPDGRGPATGWRYGETEDYLLRPQGECDLTIGKKHSPTQFEYGGVGTYHIGVTNSGNALCQGPIVVTDTLPEGLVFDAGSVSGTGWSCTSSAPANPETVTCTHPGPLPASTSLDALTFDVSIPDIGDAGGQGWNGDSVTNCATVDGPNDADSSNNTACDTAIIVSPPLSCDLRIGKEHSPSPFEYGGVGTYHIGVTNVGTGPCRGPIVVTDTLPEGMVFDASSVAGTGWSCTSNAPANPETVTCTHPGPLPASTSLDVLTFDVSVPNVGDAGGHGWNGDVAINCAVVDGPNDVNPDNNEGCDKVEVIPPLLCDLSVEKWHDPDPFVYGGTGSYTIAVSNLGDGFCKGPITISDTLPAGMVFDSTSVTGTGWSCTSNAPISPETVTCTYAGSVLPMTSITPVVFDVSVPTPANAGGEGWNGDVATNCVKVEGPNDSDPTNNQACDEAVCIECEPGTETYHGGVADNFASGNVELTHRSPALDDYITYHTDGEYDESSANRFFGESFIIPDSETRHICGATLIIRLDQLGELQGNDTISLNFIEYDSSGTAVQAVPGGGWSYNVGNLLTLLAGGASPATLTLDLSALPLTGGGTKDLLGSFSALRYLDVMVQDDTAVDFVDLVVDYCCDEEAQSDFGDAPDSNNSGGHPMIAYPTLGVQGMFPSVYVGATTVPGPRHENPRDGAWLGAQVTLEQDADQLPDEDAPNTNIDPANDLANRDLADDALQQKLLMPICNEMKFDYSATNVSSMNNWYVNVWIDFNQDGDWNDTIKCQSSKGATRLVREWAVQDQMVVLPTGTSSLLTTPAFNATNVKVDGMWMRMMLSESPSAGSDGRGPVDGYRFGETEDYLLPPRRGIIHGHKWHDLNGNGVWDRNEPVIANWPIVLTGPDGRNVRTTTDANGEYAFVDLPDGEYIVREGQRRGWKQTSPANGEGYTIAIEDAAIVEDQDFGNVKSWTEYCVTPKQINYGEGSTRTGIKVTVYNRGDQKHTYTVAVFDAEGTNLVMDGSSNALAVASKSKARLPLKLDFAAAKAGTYQVMVSSDANTKFGCEGNLAIQEDGLLLEGKDDAVVLGNAQKPTIRFPFRNSNDVPITVGYRIRADLFAFASGGRASQSSISLDGQAAGTDVVGQITIAPNSTAEIPVSISWSGSSIDFEADITLEADTNGDGKADTSATAYVEPSGTLSSIQLRHAGQQTTSNVVVLLFIMLSMVTVIPMRRRYRN
ncbi:MAG: GEVED domain-containing protein [Candidatus Promineifilaceae bacterium]